MRPDPATALPRFEGPLARAAHLFALLEDAQAANDVEREREVSESLARLLSARGTELDVAVRLARRALVLGDDPILRSDVAGWLSGLGDPTAAALELRAGRDVAPGTTLSRTLVRVAVLLARANKPDLAVLVLEEAAEADQADPMPCELVGLLSSWASAIVPAERGVRGYLDAAQRHRGAGDGEAALEDLLRACELDPTSPDAADAIGAALVSRGRTSAADELAREHAFALAESGRPGDARRAHARRLSSALARDDAAAAASVAFDLGIAQTDRDIAARVDEALGRAGLWELCSARLAERARSGADRSAAYVALARTYEGALPSTERAIDAHVGVLASDSTARASLDALRDHAQRTGDHRPLAEALLASMMSGKAQPVPSGASPAWIDHARELADEAEGPLDDPKLAAWVYAELARATDTEREQAEFARIRLEARIAERSAEIARVEAAFDAAGPDSGGPASGPSRDARLASLRKLERLYGMSPELAERAFAVLASIVRADPADDRAARALDWLFARDPHADVHADLYESVLRARLEAPVSPRERVRLRTLLAGLALGAGDAARAHEDVAPLLEHPDAEARGGSVVALFATIADAPRELARGVAMIAKTAAPPVAAVLHAVASEAWHRAGVVVEARRAAEDALTADPGCARAASALARAASSLGGREGAVVLERALGVAVTRAWLCDALARCLESIGESALAFAWTQRWLALTPGDDRAIAELLRRCQAGADARRIADALGWVLAQPAPPSQLPAFLDALVLLFGLDRSKAAQVSRRALDVIGPRDEGFRERLLALADQHGDEPLAIALLERHVATVAEPTGELYLDLASRRLRAKDLDGSARELVRGTLAGADPRVVIDACDELERRDTVQAQLGSDGHVWVAEARARASSVLLGEEDAPSLETRALVAQAWRTLAGARWDLAQDPRGCEQALFTAAEQDPERGFDQYARDLFDLAAPDHAIGAIFERISLEEDEPKHVRVALALAAANAATEQGLASWALDAACRVLALEPGHPDAIAIAEMHAPDVERGAEALDGIFSALAAAAMGSYGRRAAHYRAARQLEALGAPSLAQQHALRALEAVPNEGAIFDLVRRLTDPVKGAPEAVELFEALGARAPREERALWTKRAMDLCGDDRAGLERRLEVALRGYVASPEMRLVASLEEALGKLAADGGLPDTIPERLQDIAQQTLPELEGPDGARTAALLSRALVTCERPEAAMAALERAARIDGDVEVYDQLTACVPVLAAAPEEATAFSRGVLERTQSKHELVGPPLIRLAAAVADAVADSATSERLYAELERRETAEAEGGSTRESIHDDPFADPSMLDSVPPPSIRSAPPPSVRAAPEPEPEPEAQTEPDPQISMEPEPTLPDDLDLPAVSEAEPPNSGEPEVAAVSAGPESVAQIFDSILPSAASSTPTPSPSRPVSVPPRDGFDALFSDEEGPGSLEDADLARREAEARDRGDHEAVSELLHKRINTSSWTEQVRVLKLRRAVVLDQRLDRRDDAKRELEEILASSPEDKSALALLAGMVAEGGSPERAAQLWDRLAAQPTTEPAERREYALRAARTYLDAKDAPSALRVLDREGGPLLDDESAVVRVQALRAAGESRQLVVAIDQLVASGSPTERECSALLVEAARASFAFGDEAGALSRARRAQRYAPGSPDAVLECTKLEYRARGMGTPREAQGVVEVLGSIAGALEPEHVPLHTFLLAEALDVIQGGGAGMRELSKRHAELGPRPLLALGMAERLARSRSFESAVPLFEQALSGDLGSLRSRGRVALSAADAALQAEALDFARRFLAIAEETAELAPHIERRKRELLALGGDPEEARPILEELARTTSGIAKARFLVRLGQITLKTDLPVAIDLYEEAIRCARRDRAFAERIRNELIALLEVHGPLSGVEVEELPPPSSRTPEPIEEPPPSYAEPPPTPRSEPAPDRPAELEMAAVKGPPSSGKKESPAPSPGPPPLPRREAEPREEAAVTLRARYEPLGKLGPAARPSFTSPEEEALFDQLLAGYVDAGDELIERYGDEDVRTHDALIVRRHQAALRPGHTATLQMLREAALADRDEVYARALEHALRVGARTTVMPPPLAAQPREPDLVQNLLVRGVSSRETEVLSLVWECGMYRRDLASYGLSGADRVPLTLQSVLGELYSELVAHLGAPRALFHKRGPGQVSVGIALLSQPALVVTGDVTERSTDLAYALAAAHVTATQDLVLAASLPDAALRRLLDGVSAAFGPVAPRSEDAPASSTDAFRADVARIAEELWQRVNPREDRRLRELCEEGALDLAAGRATARRAMRRAGLFATGDLGTTLRFTALELGFDEDLITESAGLERFASSSADVADVVRLATSVEYAEARWQAASPRSGRPSSDPRRL